MKIQLDINKIKNINLERFNDFIIVKSRIINFHCKPGKEHYRLLAYLSTCFNNSIIFDIGTQYGLSALALSYNLSNLVHSFDIVDVIGDKHSKSPKDVSNIKLFIDDIVNPERREIYKQELLDSPIVFIDIDPHEGTREYNLYKWFLHKNYQGILLFDDVIHFPDMKDNFWSKVDPKYKYDLTRFGHWSGTGAIIFNKQIEFEMI